MVKLISVTNALAYARVCMYQTCAWWKFPWRIHSLVSAWLLNGKSMAGNLHQVMNASVLSGLTKARQSDWLLSHYRTSVKIMTLLNGAPFPRSGFTSSVQYLSDMVVMVSQLIGLGIILLSDRTFFLQKRPDLLGICLAIIIVGLTDVASGRVNWYFSIITESWAVILYIPSSYRYRYAVEI